MKEDDQEDQDLDVSVIDITLDIVIKMAKLTGPYFDPAFQELYPFICKYYQVLLFYYCDSFLSLKHMQIRIDPLPLDVLLKYVML